MNEQEFQKMALRLATDSVNAYDRGRLEQIENTEKVWKLEQEWHSWAREVLDDYKTPYDNHTVGLRMAITQLLYDLAHK